VDQNGMTNEERRHAEAGGVADAEYASQPGREPRRAAGIASRGEIP
jgi:hypothetical protein